MVNITTIEVVSPFLVLKDVLLLTLLHQDYLDGLHCNQTIIILTIIIIIIIIIIMIIIIIIIIMIIIINNERLHQCIRVRA